MESKDIKEKNVASSQSKVATSDPIDETSAVLDTAAADADTKEMDPTVVREERQDAKKEPSIGYPVLKDAAAEATPEQEPSTADGSTVVAESSAEEEPAATVEPPPVGSAQPVVESTAEIELVATAEPTVVAETPVEEEPAPVVESTVVIESNLVVAPVQLESQVELARPTTKVDGSGEMRDSQPEQSGALKAEGVRPDFAAPLVVAADSVQAEEVPTIPLGSLQAINSLQPEISVHSVAPARTLRQPGPLVAQPSEYQRGLKEWLQVWRDGVRPAYLALSLLPALLGSTLAWAQTVTPRTPLGRLNLILFAATLLTIIFLQLGANLVNDYYDYLRGVDTSNTFGPGGLIQQGLVQPSRVLAFGLILLAIGTVPGMAVGVAGGPLALLVGLIGVLCAYFYSATRRALSLSILGELVTIVIFGPLITMGAFMVQRGFVAPIAFFYSIPLSLLALAVVHANNMRDAEGDAQAGKHTLATRLGLRGNRILYILLLLGAYAVLAWLGIPPRAPHLILIALWTFPLLVVAITGVLRTDTPACFHLVMRQTLKLETYFVLLLIIALIISALIPVLPHLPAKILPI